MSPEQHTVTIFVQPLVIGREYLLPVTGVVLERADAGSIPSAFVEPTLTGGMIRL